jgi:hypothetical protein
MYTALGLSVITHARGARKHEHALSSKDDSPRPSRGNPKTLGDVLLGTAGDVLSRAGTDVLLHNVLPTVLPARAIGALRRHLRHAFAGLALGRVLSESHTARVHFAAPGGQHSA